MALSSNEIKKAHQELDRAVDRCYINKSFKNDRECIEFLFELYEKYIKEINNG